MDAGPPDGATVAILGAGNMAGAIARALAAAGAVARLRLTTGSSVPTWLRDHPGVTHQAVSEHPRANIEAVEGADAVILGVKPHAIVGLAREIAPALAPGTLVLSVAGGVTVAALAQALPADAVAVRTMPNTPVAVGQGITAYALGAAAPADADRRVRDLLAPTGAVISMPEHEIDGFSAIVGSGPAYVYFVVEALEAAAVDRGMTAEQARLLVPRMMGGAIAYLEATGRDPAQLRAEVTSPGGSTAAALAVFGERGVAQALREGTAAAAARARHLGES